MTSDRVTCRYCGAEESATAERFEAAERMLGLGGCFEYVVCDECGSWTLGDVPADLSPYYPDREYYSYSLGGRARLRTRLRWAKGSAFRRLPRRVRAGIPPWHASVATPAWAGWYERAGLDPSARVLDIGCGDGTLVRDLVRTGSVASAVGFDPYYRGPEDDLVRIERESLGELGADFTHVFFHHSLEHVEDPLAALVEARELLAPNGLVLVRVPVTDSLPARAFGEYWSELDAPRHVGVPSTRGLHALAERAAMQVVAEWRDGSALELLGSLAYAEGHRINDEPFVRRVASKEGVLAARLVDEWSRRGVAGRAAVVLRVAD